MEVRMQAMVVTMATYDVYVSVLLHLGPKKNASDNFEKSDKWHEDKWGQSEIKTSVIPTNKRVACELGQMHIDPVKPF